MVILTGLVSVILARLLLESLDKSPEDSILFLDRPTVPELLRASDIAPQFCNESLRFDALRAGRRLPFIERFLERHPLAL